MPGNDGSRHLLLLAIGVLDIVLDTWFTANDAPLPSFLVADQHRRRGKGLWRKPSVALIPAARTTHGELATDRGALVVDGAA